MFSHKLQPVKQKFTLTFQTDSIKFTLGFEHKGGVSTIVPHELQKIARLVYLPRGKPLEQCSNRKVFSLGAEKIDFSSSQDQDFLKSSTKLYVDGAQTHHFIKIRLDYL